MKDLSLYYYEYSKELRQFSKLDVGNGHYPIKELVNIVECLEENLIQYEVDEKFNIKLLKIVNKVEMESLINHKFH